MLPPQPDQFGGDDRRILLHRADFVGLDEDGLEPGRRHEPALPGEIGPDGGLAPVGEAGNEGEEVPGGIPRGWSEAARLSPPEGCLMVPEELVSPPAAGLAVDARDEVDGCEVRRKLPGEAPQGTPCHPPPTPAVGS